MNELHLFAGCGGGILGGMLLGHRTVCAVEIEPYRRKSLFQRQRDGILPRFPIWDDVRTFNGNAWRGKVDVVCGGFPCQRFSTAHHGTPTADDLWPEMLRVVKESEPRWVFAENVAADPILRAASNLHELGFLGNVCKLSASDVGADHIRERYWLLAHTNNESQLLCEINAKMEVCETVQPRIWETFSEYSRMDDGMAHRMDRLEAAGDGQIPAMVKIAWETLMAA